MRVGSSWVKEERDMAMPVLAVGAGGGYEDAGGGGVPQAGVPLPDAGGYEAS